MMDKLATNCTNCGAVMQYSEQYYGKMYKCPYCKTEHHIDLLGRIEEYKVKFMFMGQLIEAYLTNFECNQDYIEATSLVGSRTMIIPGQQTLNFEFIGNVVEDINNDN